MEQAPKNPAPTSGSVSKLEQAATFEKMRDLKYLPTREEIKAAFPTFGELRDTEGRVYQAGVSDTDFDKIHKPGHAHELLNKEFIVALGNHIIDRIQAKKLDRPYVILELAAGNGRLSHFLEQELSARMPGKVSVIATDNGKESISPIFNNVEKLDGKEALQKHDPDLVVVSWMRDDLTTEIRKKSSVDEYILIGEPATTGSPWETWGDEGYPEYNFETDDYDKTPYEGETPPFIEDRFVMKEIDSISETQINRGGVNNIHSRTYSFRRVGLDNENT